MSRLSPCVGCERHVRKTEAHCPFCGVERVRPPGESFTSLAPIVAAAVALAGCTEPAAETTTPTSIVTTDLQPVDTSTATATATATDIAPTPEPTASATPTTSASSPSPLPTATLTERPAKPMYGMPPPQDRPRMKYGMPKM